MRKRLVTVVMLAAFLSLPAVAQPDESGRVFTLREAVLRVQAVGFDVRAARAEAQIADADARTARAGTQPQIGVSVVGFDANLPQLGMPVARQTYGQAFLSVPLLAPATWSGARAAAKSAAAAASSADATVDDAILAVAQAYRRAQLGDAVLAARRVAVQDQESHLRLAELRVSTGKAPRYLVSRDRAALGLAVQAQEDAAAERDESHNDLAALLDLGLDAHLAVEALAPIAFNETLDVLTARALQRRPALIAGEARVTAAQASLTAARAAYLPTATLTAQSYNGVSSPNLGRAGGQVQLTATLPVVDGGSRSAAIQRARGELDRVTALRDQVRRGVARDVANAYRELQAAQRNLATAQTAQADADEQYRVALLRETAGKSIELEVLDAISVEANAREGALRALTRYDNAVAAVHHAVGDRDE